MRKRNQTFLNVYCSGLLNSYLALQVLCLSEYRESAFFLSFFSCGRREAMEEMKGFI